MLNGCYDITFREDHSCKNLLPRKKGNNLFEGKKMGQLSEKYVRRVRIRAIVLAGLFITMINKQDYDNKDEFGSYSELQVTA